MPYMYIYMVCHLPSIYPSFVGIYTIHGSNGQHTNLSTESTRKNKVLYASHNMSELSQQYATIDEGSCASTLVVTSREYQPWYPECGATSATKSLSWLLQKAPKTLDNYSLWMLLILVASYTLVFIGFCLMFFFFSLPTFTSLVPCRAAKTFDPDPFSRPRPSLGCTSWQGQGPGGPPNLRPLFEYRGGFPQKILFYLGVSINGGESPNGWFIRENPI